MPSLGRYTSAVLLLSAYHVAASPSPDPSPKVFGLEFKKQVPRNTPVTNRLRKRQNTVTADINNVKIA